MYTRVHTRGQYASRLAASLLESASSLASSSLRFRIACLQVTVVEQQQNIFLDEAWSAEWVDGVYDGQLNIQVRAHLENLIDLQDDTEGGSPEEKEKPFVQRAWPVLCKAVKAAVVEAAAEAKKAASENPDVVPPPAAKVVTPAQLLRDEDLKTWMLSLNMRFEDGFDDIVDVLRDELTGVQESRALKEEAVEH